jgi:hypothetical protein
VFSILKVKKSVRPLDHVFATQKKGASWKMIGLFDLVQ